MPISLFTHLCFVVVILLSSVLTTPGSPGSISMWATLSHHVFLPLDFITICYDPERTDQTVIEVLGSPRAKLR